MKTYSYIPNLPAFSLMIKNILVIYSYTAHVEDRIQNGQINITNGVDGVTIRASVI